MATMYITEYATAIGSGALQVPQEPPLAVQKVTFTTSTASLALHDDTRFVSIQLDTAGHVHFNNVPVATTSTSRKHAADAVSFHGTLKGMKIAAITA